MTAWVQETVATYFQNATSVRDFRTQMRGIRGVLLLTVYLMVLVAIALIVYSSAPTTGSIVIVQSQLRAFYTTVLATLATMVFLIAPGLAATAITQERQRKSLDLLFSAPVTPKYFLIGKLFSAYRYVWMLLILALPVTASCVVLGGASWTEVLEAYALLSFHGLVFASLALLASAISAKPIGAIVAAYGLCGIVAFGGAVSAGMATIGPMMTGSFSQERPFAITLSPFFVSEAAGTYSVIGPWNVPNWILALLATIAFVKILVLGAGSVLSVYGSHETRSLRIHGLVYAAALAFFFGLATIPSGPDHRGLFWALSVPLLFAWPSIACYGTDKGRRFWPDGLFRFRQSLTGAPSGGMAYLLLVIVVGVVGDLAGHRVGASGMAWIDLASLGQTVLLMVGFWTLCWAIARFVSAFNMTLSGARTLAVTALIGLLFLPVALLAMVSAVGQDRGQNWDWVWGFYPIAPMVDDRFAWTAWIHGGWMLAAGVFLSRMSERIGAKRFAPSVWNRGALNGGP